MTKRSSFEGDGCLFNHACGVSGNSDVPVGGSRHQRSCRCGASLLASSAGAHTYY